MQQDWTTGAELDDQVRKDLGAFYTPPWATARMVGMIDDLPTRGSFLEPSGGDGAFVTALTDTGVDAANITVWDINPEVEDTITNLGAAVSIGDALLSNLPGTFDVIIGNPPYLNKASSYVRENKKELAGPYKSIGVNDTYALFMYMAVQRLNQDGQMIFLVSDTFLTLGIHRKLREFLLSNTRVDEVCLLPADTFADASVHTAIIKVTRTVAPDDHEVVFRDARGNACDDVDAAPVYRVLATDLKNNPGALFAFTAEDTTALTLVRTYPPLMGLLDGGLGMHTADNKRYLRSLTGPGAVALDQVPFKQFQPYHKKGGATRWFTPLDHVLDTSPEAVKHYGIPATALAGRDKDGNPRRGFVLSGVSSRLAARSMVRDAMWESNKVFGFFPKDPGTYPVEFFLAVLNSSVYSRIARALNHTVSFQVRDVKLLPLLPFTPEEVSELAELGGMAVAHVRDGGRDAALYEQAIDVIVERAAAR